MGIQLVLYYCTNTILCTASITILLQSSVGACYGFSADPIEHNNATHWHTALDCQNVPDVWYNNISTICIVFMYILY